ncbi:hypothetical protein HYW99_02430 [Candidatus Woesearchaeota archaeon]|nr:hypothetical protein [Candidatus Woesearchaeota archaeon]
MNKTKNNYNIKVIIAIAILIIIILGIYRVGKTYISVYRQEKDLVGSSIPSAPLETITINASQAIEQVTLLHGFVHGFQDVNSIPTSTRERIKSLHTKFWRTGGNTELIEIPELFNVPYITFVLGDKYVWSKQKPWDDWQEYEQYVTSTVLNHPEVTYWDVWGEPDTETGSFGTSFVNMLKVFRRTHDAIRRVKPGVKIIGPSTAGFNKLKMNLFLQFSADNNLRFDGISWHEFESPNIIPNNIDEVRKMVNSYNLGNPEIHINEFSPYKNHLIPAWTVGWLYYFELANATVTNRACWDVEEGRDRWSDCWYGLDGLF